MHRVSRGIDKVRKATMRKNDITYPASCASCPRIMPRSSFRSRNLQAASYLSRAKSLDSTSFPNRLTHVKKYEQPLVALCSNIVPGLSPGP